MLSHHSTTKAAPSDIPSEDTELDSDMPDESIIIMCGTLGIRLYPDGDGFTHQHGGMFPAIGSDSLAALYALIQHELIAARDLTQVRRVLAA